MRSAVPLLLSLFLVACATTPTETPAARKQAEASQLAAAQASRAGKWPAALALWRETEAKQTALDDWPAAGQARLGQAQAQAALGAPEEALATLQALLQDTAYPPALRAEAQYQAALLRAGQQDWSAAQALLDAATPLIPTDHPLQAAIFNLRARAALAGGDWAQARSRAGQALTVARIEPGERANALRLQGQAAMRQADWPSAKQNLEAALELDRTLARHRSLVADLQALAELAHLRNAPEADELERRARAVCTAGGGQDCGMPGTK